MVLHTFPNAILGPGEYSFPF
jgi:hypothetical protein